jgi:hypothetical protein
MGDNWFDPVGTGLRDRVREFLQAMLEAEPDEVLARSRYASPVTAMASGHARCCGHSVKRRSRCCAPRLDAPDGKTTEWKSRALRAYQRRTLADALIAG